MAFLDQLRSFAARVTSRRSTNISSDLSELQGLYGTDFLAAFIKFGDAVKSNGAQKLEEIVPDPEHREKIRRIVMNLGKLVIETALSGSLKGVNGGIQLYNIVQEALKNQPSQSIDVNKKPDHIVMVQEMQAKMEKMLEEMNNTRQLKVMVKEMQANIEKMQEDLNNLRQLNAISTQCVKASDPSQELLTEPPEKLALPRTDVGKVRSRL